MGEFLDVIVEYNRLMNPPGKKKQEDVKIASQADFDAF